MKNTLTYQNSIQHLLSNVDDGTNKLIVDGTEIPSSTWEGTGTFTITSGSATITIEQIENASNIMLQKVSTNNYKLVDAGAAGKVNLESDVTGTLPIGNGGTGSSAGDSKDLIATFTSADNSSIFNSGNLGAQSAYAWNAVATMASAEKHSSLFNKISTMFKNIRTIAKFLGTTDISAIGGGTVSGAISALNNSLTNKTVIQRHDALLTFQPTYNEFNPHVPTLNGYRVVGLVGMYIYYVGGHFKIIPQSYWYDANSNTAYAQFWSLESSAVNEFVGFEWLFEKQ